MDKITKEQFGEALITVLRYTQEELGGALCGTAEYIPVDPATDEPQFGDENMFHIDVHNVNFCGCAPELDKRRVN